MTIALTGQQALTNQENGEAFGCLTCRNSSGILEELRDVIVLHLDVLMRIVWANTALSHIVGMPLDDLVGHPCYERVMGRSAACPGCCVPRSLATGLAHESEVVMPNRRVYLLHSHRTTDSAGAMGVVVSAVDITDHKRSEQEMRHSRDLLQILSKRLSEAQEAERRKLAQELHDQVGQYLTVASLNLNYVRSHLPQEAGAPVHERLDQAVAQLEHLTTCIRNVMSSLYPAVLGECGLGAALRWYAEQYQCQTGIRVSVAVEQRLKRMPPETEIALFRIVQETMNNAHKHGAASELHVSAAADNCHTTVTVEDNGRGFDCSAVAGPGPQSGWGLSIMRERAAALGGSLRIESQPGQGTRVVAVVPTSRPTILGDGKE